ncbi:polyketide cyclase [Lysobacter helvus]|uniref:Polyketide cyclase n=2 Tax=Lysobacteraceae TaxID=32033 RepID=A0ABN6FP04_9GAMM|nr:MULTISPECIES: polyketide cyclase [Lysobacter]BCT91301.1 polyketide cyclase [Lysobacter caseinilyticus]BCT94454.1 polyketide cyclase [Lysobacter helvus]
MTRLIEILISLAIVAVLFLVVGLVLPSSRHVTESIETNRKMTIVRDTLNSPKRLKDWNVLALRDPRMQWTFSGPETGVGATASYSSTNAQIGKGSWKIVKSEPTRIEYEIVDPARGAGKHTVFNLKPTGRNNRNVEIVQTYDVDYGFDLLGRYSGMYIRSVGDDIKLGLGKLTNMLAGVPNYDYAADFGRKDPANLPKVVELQGENLLTAPASVERDPEKIQTAMSNNLQWIRKVMDANGLEATGPVRVITTEFAADSYSFDTVLPVRKKGETGPSMPLSAPKLEQNVQYVRTEPGRYVSAGFQGHMLSLPKMRDSLRAWTMTRGLETTDRPFEVWNAGVDAGFTDEGQFTLFWKLK